MEKVKILPIIIIQNRNHGQFLPDVIKSVRGQLKADSTLFERDSYILVGIDSGSTDNSKEVYMKYGVPCVDCKGLNQAKSVNKVLREYNKVPWTHFTWINADDWFYPNFIATHLKALKETKCDIVHSGASIYYGKGKSMGRSNPQDADRYFSQRWGNPVSQPTAMVEREVFDKIGLFDESFVYTFDYEFWARAWMKNITFYSLNISTVYRRCRKECMTNTCGDKIRPEMERVLDMLR